MGFTMSNFASLGSVNFPNPKGININTFPFIMGDPNSLPEEYREYQSLIDACSLPESELGKVGYLTVSESFVAADKSQRRGGVHTEKHPSLSWGGGGWGGRDGGLYMSSTVGGSCAVWDTYVDTPGHMGDCEHLRDTLGNETLLKGSELVWMTDGTPHEALPQKESGYRQFFRLVTSEVSLWYEEHSTANRLGIRPNCEIIKGSKF